MIRTITILAVTLFCIHTDIFGQKLRFPQKKDTTAVSVADSIGNPVQIDRIFIIGNKKTKERIIRRELNIQEGQILNRKKLEAVLEADRKKILNTRLFLTVSVNIVELDENRVDVIIRVAERWYFFPIPVIGLADRNFTEWWVNQKHDFKRIDYGVKLIYFNFRGRNETLGAVLQFGYTKFFKLTYDIPYIDRKQKIGLKIYADYATNKNIDYQTVDHRLQFFGEDKVLKEEAHGGFYLGYRPNFYSFHHVGFHYSRANVVDTVLSLNPQYFLNDRLKQQYFSLSYSYTRDYRDYVSYPLNGSYLKVNLTKNGLGIYDDLKSFDMDLKYSRYFDLGKKFYLGSSYYGRASFPDEQPYYNYYGIGYEKTFMRGYEPYVIAGQHFLVNNNYIKKQLFQFEKDIRNVLKIRQFSKIPFAAYLALNFDQGYIVNYRNNAANKRFSDKYICGGGVGIDIVSFYDFVMRWEYSINISGEKSLYFNLRAAF